MNEVFNIKWISLLTSKIILTFFTTVKQLKVNFNFSLKKIYEHNLCIIVFSSSFSVLELLHFCYLIRGLFNKFKQDMLGFLKALSQETALFHTWSGERVFAPLTLRCLMGYS